MVDGVRANRPVDRVAVRVAFAKGEAYEPTKKIVTRDSDAPIAWRGMRSVDVRSGRENLAGRRFGRFVVLGIAVEGHGWVVRCQCGRYSVRNAKAICNPRNSADRCEHCRHVAYLKRAEFFRRTGVDRDVDVGE